MVIDYRLRLLIMIAIVIGFLYLFYILSKTKCEVEDLINGKEKE
jgi:hypothetical protein